MVVPGVLSHASNTAATLVQAKIFQLPLDGFIQHSVQPFKVPSFERKYSCSSQDDASVLNLHHRLHRWVV